jgi:hypothetical protein
MNTSIVNAMWLISGMIIGWIACWVTHKTKIIKEPEIIDIKPDDKPDDYKPKPKRTRKKKIKSVQSAQDILDEVIKEDKDREKIATDLNRSEETQQVLVD